MGAFHSTWGYIAVAINGLVGLSLLGYHLARRPGSLHGVLAISVGIAVAALVIQVVGGVIAMTQGVEPGNQHVFYGVVIAFTLAFAYIYRAQFAKKPALAFGLLHLFMMGLSIRGIMTFGHSF